MPSTLYLDTSAVLRAILESGTSPEIEKRIGGARGLITSRLALVEAARAFHRIRASRKVSEEELADAGRELDALWARCDIWELTPLVCEMAGQVAPTRSLRTLDALHLATYLLARRRIEGVELLSADQRLLDAAQGVRALRPVLGLPRGKAENGRTGDLQRPDAADRIGPDQQVVIVAHNRFYFLKKMPCVAGREIADSATQE
jgi:predicted nucleic acid-binding protein